MMKALSIKQPWAWLICNGYKDIENRTWRTRYKGNILIHASKSPDKVNLSTIRLLLANDTAFEQLQDAQKTDSFYGGIVGQAEIIDCVNDHPSRWFFGPWGFVFSEAKPIPFVPYKGKLFFFDVPDNLIGD